MVPWYLSALVDRHPLARAGADVLGVGADQAVVGVLLADVGGPAGHAGGGEQRGVEVGRDPHRRVHAGRVEVDVGVQPLLLHHRLLDLVGDLEPVGVAEPLAEAAAHLAQDPGARVPGLVDAVAEPHHLLLVAQPVLDVVGGPVGRADLVEHVADLLDRAAVQPPLQRGDGGGHGRVHVGQRRRRDPAGEGRRVHGVVGVEQQADVEVPGELLVRLLAGERVEEAAGQRLVVARLDRVAAGPQALDGIYFFFSSRRRHTRLTCDWSSDVCSSDLPTPAQGPGDPAKGSMAPTFELTSIPDGKSVPLASFRGKAVLLNFWATWCGPCKIEMPWLVDLQKKYGPQGLQIVGVAMDDTSNKEIADFAHKMGVNYVVLKGTEKVGDLYGGVDRLPLTYFVDRSGKVVDEIVGLRSASDIEDAIKKTLAQGN